MKTLVTAALLSMGMLGAAPAAAVAAADSLTFQVTIKERCTVVACETITPVTVTEVWTLHDFTTLPAQTWEEDGMWGTNWSAIGSGFSVAYSDDSYWNAVIANVRNPVFTEGVRQVNAGHSIGSDGPGASLNFFENLTKNSSEGGSNTAYNLTRWLGTNWEYAIQLGGTDITVGTLASGLVGQTLAWELSSTYEEWGGESELYETLSYRGTATVLAEGQGDTGGESGAVPEPASWAMMIAGFGAIGATARRRRAALTA